MKKVFIIFFLCLLHKQLIAQNPPGEPNIAWMEIEYQLSDGNVDITFVWDMWWGENGDHWKLLQNGNVIYETEIAPNTPQPQHDEVIINFTVTGQFDFMIDLCNYYERDEICTSSNPITIIILGGEGETEIDHGFGISEWGEQYFSPFVDATGWPPLSLSEIAEQTGVKYFNLGFIVARSGDNCQATWGGYYDLDGWTFSGDFMFPLIEDNEIGQIREMGGDVMISIGGAANTPLASATDNLEDLKTQYRDIVETYELTHLDFDIEGIWILDNDATILRAQALAELQTEWENENRDVKIWFTLPVLPDGLTADGVFLIETTVDSGVELEGFNIMAMDFGDATAPDPEGQMGYYAIQSAESLHSQLSQIYPENTSEEIWQMVGVTPMIGLNDVITEIFTLSDAQQLTDFAISENLKEISMWSTNRDFECEDGESDIVYIDCSSIFQEPYEFSDIFNVIMDDPIPPPWSITVDYQSDWNLVGLPLEVEDANYLTIFPDAIENTLFSFDDAYIPDSIMVEEEGYWLRFNDEEGSTTITGGFITELTISMNEGWNLISGISTPLNITEIQDPDEIIISGTVYQFISGVYLSADEIKPGKGYWIRANSSGNIILISE